jgi:hypothetical protein
VLDASLDDTFRRLAAKNQFSHWSKRHDAHNDSQHSDREQSEQHSNFKARKSLEHGLPAATRRVKQFNRSLLTCLSRWWRRRLLARQLDEALGCERLRSVSSVTLSCGRTGIEARRMRPWLLRLSTTAA